MHKLKYLLLITSPHGLFEHTPSLTLNFIRKVNLINLQQYRPDIPVYKSYQLIILDVQYATHYPLRFSHGVYLLMKGHHVLRDELLQGFAGAVVVFELGYFYEGLEEDVERHVYLVLVDAAED